MESKNEIVQVWIYYGYGISFMIDFIAEKGCPEDKLKEYAINHFKTYMPSPEQVASVEQLLLDGKAHIEVVHENQVKV